MSYLDVSATGQQFQQHLKTSAAVDSGARNTIAESAEAEDGGGGPPDAEATQAEALEKMEANGQTAEGWGDFAA